MKQVDLVKTLKNLYSATRRFQEVNAGVGTFLAVDGKGKPGGDAFQHSIQCLYSIAYTTKFALKHQGVIDFKVGRLECLYLSEPGKTPISQWRWRFLLRIPDDVTARHLTQSKKMIKERKGLDASAVKRIRWKEGRAVQVLHVGPYDKVAATYEALAAYAKEHGLIARCPAHEIYISDPCRVDPERLKTIIRLAVKKGRS